MPSKSARKQRNRPRASAPERRQAIERAEATKPPPRWQWRTFPVFFALMTGLLLASFVNGAPANDAAAAVQIVALAGFGYGLAHLFATNVVLAGRMRSRRNAIDRGDTPAEDWEEETVYPDDAAAR